MVGILVCMVGALPNMVGTLPGTVGTSICSVGFYHRYVHGGHTLCHVCLMQDASRTFDAISYSAAISAWEKGGQWEQVLSLLKEMQDASLTFDRIS